MVEKYWAGAAAGGIAGYFLGVGLAWAYSLLAGGLLYHRAWAFEVYGLLAGVVGGYFLARWWVNRV